MNYSTAKDEIFWSMVTRQTEQYNKNLPWNQERSI